MSSEGYLAMECDNQETQLLQAALYGSLDLVKKFLTPDNVNIRDAIGRTPLALACWKGHYAIVEHLLKAGADISNVFRQAKTLKHSRIVELLLEHGADFNVEYSIGRRPLHRACCRGNVQVAEVLLKFGADVNAKDWVGNTPLHFATALGNLPLTVLLLKHHAEVNIANILNQTPLYIRQSLPVVRLLLENGADPNMLNLFTCEYSEIYQKALDTFVILLDYGFGSMPCRTRNCGSCEGESSILSCEYSKLKAQAAYDEELKLAHAPLLAAFERHHVKVLVLGDDYCLTRFCVNPSVSPDHALFGAKCAAELKRIKLVSGDVYHHILKQDLPSLLHYPVYNVTPKRCRKLSPIYGDMIYANFLKIKRRLLLEQCSILFSLTDLPRLPPECVPFVLRYLSDEDLSNASKLCLSHPQWPNSYFT